MTKCVGFLLERTPPPVRSWSPGDRVASVEVRCGFKVLVERAVGVHHLTKMTRVFELVL